jgi:hypothetical protein
LALTAHTDLSTGHHHPAIDAASYSAGHSYTNIPPGKKNPNQTKTNMLIMYYSIAFI